MSSAATSRALLAGALALLSCGPGDIDDPGPTTDPKLDLGGGDAGVVGDPWNCGELGLTCTGPLNIGSCIDGQCGARLIGPCLSPQFAPTCDAFCQFFERSCAYLGCEGATAYGWHGTQYEADNSCATLETDTIVSLTVSCDQPLAGVITSVMCCCQK